jgi:hypothetical protein
MKARGSAGPEGVDHGLQRAARLRFPRTGIVLAVLAVCGGIWWWLSRAPPLPPGRAALWDDATDPLPPAPNIGSGKGILKYADERIIRTSQYVTMRDGVRLTAFFGPNFEFAGSSVPEPSSWILLFTITGFICYLRRRTLRQTHR